MLVWSGGLEMFKSHWDFHTAGSGCVPLSPIPIIPHYSQHKSRRRKNWLNRIISGGEQPSRSAQVGNLLFLGINNTTVSVSHLAGKIRSWTMWGCLSFLNAWACVLPLLPGGFKAQSLSFVDDVLLSERLNSTSWLSKTQFTVFCLCLL